MKKTFFTTILIIFCLALQAQHDEYIFHLSDYIKFPSTKGKEREAGLYFMNLAEQKGLHTRILTETAHDFNFLVSLYPLSSKKPNYVFLNHIDVVDPGDSSKWNVPPFSGFVDDTVVWGRGAIDNKGMAMAQLAAVSEFASIYKDADLPFNVSILSVSGEETGSTGAKKVIKNWLDELNIYFVLGEGGSGVTGVIPSHPEKPLFGISTSEKSRIVYELELKLFTSGHASVPPSEYALKEMIQALSRIVSDRKRLIFNEVNKKSLRQLGKIEGGVKGFILRHHGFPLFRPLVKSQIKKDPMISSFFSNTISITNFSSLESDDNQFPGIVSVTLDCRLLPGTDPGKFTRQLHRKLKDERIDVKIKEAVISPGRTYNKQLFNILNESVQTVYPEAESIEIIFPATSDNSIFRTNGITVFGLFPGVLSEDALRNVHSINEYIGKDVFIKAAGVYTAFLMNIARMDIEEVKFSLN